MAAEMTVTEGTGISKKLLLIAAVLLGGAFLLKTVGGKGGGTRKRAKGKKRKTSLRYRRAKSIGAARRVARGISPVRPRGGRFIPIPAYPH